MNADEKASVQRLLRLLATAGAALVLVVIVTSAYLRLSQAGLSCDDWPACYGRTAVDGADTASTVQRVARFAHRVAAGAVGALLLALVLISAVQRPPLKRQTTIAVAAALIALGLAALGTATPGTRLPAVTLGNLGGGFALLALLWWLRLTTRTPRPLLPDPPAWLKICAALLMLAAIGQMTLGGMVSARFAALACPALPGCGADVPQGALLAGLDPFQELPIGADGSVMRPPELAALPVAHRIGALVVTALTLAVALRLWRERGYARAVGGTLMLLLMGQLALGGAAVLGSLPLPVVVVHNAFAALLLAALVSMNYCLHAGERGV
jgi:cytochrome c oxidase assembly protein subunit 15